MKRVKYLFAAYTTLTLVVVCSLVAFANVDVTYQGNELLWTTAGAPILIGFSLLLYKLFPQIRKQLYNSAVGYALGRLNLRGAAALAIASGVGEEVLFRGFVQEHLGLVAASVLFGLMHYSSRMKWYVPITIVIGLFLGGLTILSGSLLPAIVIHVSNNFIAFRMARKHNAMREAKWDAHDRLRELWLKKDYKVVRLPRRATCKLTKSDWQKGMRWYAQKKAIISSGKALSKSYQGCLTKPYPTTGGMKR
jgi:membrane protease YdiL (CAAX protease family)